MTNVLAQTLTGDIDVKTAIGVELPTVVVVVAAADANIYYSGSTYAIDYSHLSHYSVPQYYYFVDPPLTVDYYNIFPSDDN